jgi:hypothetical protein
LRITRYAVTPTLSLAAFHTRSTSVAVLLVAVSAVGAVGGVVSAGVVTDAAFDAGEALFAASYATTV